MRKPIAFVMLFMASISNVYADLLDHVKPELVMAGNSSAFNEGVWIRVVGLIGNPNCQYGGFWTLFYAKNDGVVKTDQVLSLAMTAQVAQRELVIDYDPNAEQADFWNFGVSKCKINRIALR